MLWRSDPDLQKLGIILAEDERDSFLVTTAKYKFTARMTALDGPALARLKEGKFVAVCMALSDERSRASVGIAETGSKILLFEPYFLIPHPQSYRGINTGSACRWLKYYEKLLEACGEYAAAAFRCRHGVANRPLRLG